IMDSMDWFDPQDIQASAQVQALYHALKTGGKVLLRSAGINPWYITTFAAQGFAPRRLDALVIFENSELLCHDPSYK
ncbi:MAG: hypothetical protein Q9164_006298, partial [Protoblastenia rupestris]